MCKIILSFVLDFLHSKTKMAFQKIAVGALLFAGVALAKPLAESDPHADPYYYSGSPYRSYNSYHGNPYRSGYFSHYARPREIVAPNQAYQTRYASVHAPEVYAVPSPAPYVEAPTAPGYPAATGPLPEVAPAPLVEAAAPVHLQPVPAVPEVVATAPVEIAFGSHKGYKTPLPVEEVAPVAIAAPAPALPVKEAVYSVPAVAAPIIAEPAPTPLAPVDHNQVVATQFHAQDEFGNVAYGYANPNAAKEERRDSNGHVRGAYSYIDATGLPKHVAYVADDWGFRVTSSNALPIAPALPEGH